MKKKVLIISIVVFLCILIGAELFIIFGVKNYKKKGSSSTVPTGEFTLSFLKDVNNKSEGNYLVSPYSVEVALSMLRDGTNGNTKGEINKLIGDKKIALLDNKTVHIANAVFIKNMYKDGINTSFNDGLKTDYKSEVLYDEFETPAVINNWADKNTDGMIKEVVNEIPKEFVLGLANALAIDVNWKYQFQCENTNSKEFTKENNEKINVEMMSKSFEYGEDVKYIESDKAKGIIIPYKDEEGLEFIAIKPNGSIDDYINNLTMDELNKLEENVKTPNSNLHIHLSLPRFKFDFDYKMFKASLKDLGIKEVFNPEKADLTAIMTRDNMTKYDIGNLYVSEAVHKTYIDLNEKGTKAAAVTYFGISKNTSIADPKLPEIINIEFDKTFLFMIRDKNTKTVLFTGVVDSPTEWTGTTCSSEN